MIEYRNKNKINEDKISENIRVEIGAIWIGLNLLFAILTTVDYCGINIWNGNQIVDLIFMIICWIFFGVPFIVFWIIIYIFIRVHFKIKKQEKRRKEEE